MEDVDPTPGLFSSPQAAEQGSHNDPNRGTQLKQTQLGGGTPRPTFTYEEFLHLARVPQISPIPFPRGRGCLAHALAPRSGRTRSCPVTLTLALMT